MPNRRRILLAGLSAAAVSSSSKSAAAAQSANAQQQQQDAGHNRNTIYIPERQAEHDRDTILNFIDEYSFAMLVTAQPTVEVTNVPTVFTRPPASSPNAWGKLWWHLAKSNHQNEAMVKGPVTAVIHGPHGYISPNWYGAKNAVPTWNFAVVHATGSVRRIESDEEFAAGLRRLVMQNEARYGGGSAWSFDAMPDSYLKGMRGGIVGYEMTIERVEAKFKLSQQSPENEREGIVRGIEKAPKERDFLAFTKAYYKRLKKE